MHRKILLVATLLFLGILSNGFAQVSADKAMSYAPEVNEIEEAESENWSVYSDEENQLYYIDFESLKVNLSDIVVRDANGQVLLKDDVFELPVNTIYELDFSQYGTGTYQIELRSFTGVIRKTISIN